MPSPSKNTNQAIRSNRRRLKLLCKNSLLNITNNSQNMLQQKILEGKTLNSLTKSPSNSQQICPGHNSAGACMNLNFQNDYELRKIIGQGAQAVVYEAASKQSGELKAVKISRGKSLEFVKTIRESFIMLKSLQHEHIIKVDSLYEDKQISTCYMVGELCQFPDLRHLMPSRKHKIFSEEQTSIIVKKLLEAAVYLHSKGICHRDLKPENVIYDETNGDLKIIDFEISRLKQPSAEKLEMWTQTGSLYYRAPETFEGSYNEQIDEWAIGIIAFELLLGHLPFKSKFTEYVIDQIISKKIQFEILNISEAARQLLKRLLDRDPEARITAKDALELDFCQDCSLSEINRCHKICLNVNQSYSSNPPEGQQLFALLKVESIS